MKYLIPLIIGSLVGGYIAYKASNETLSIGGFSDPFISLQLAANPQNGYILQTDGTNSSWVVNTAGQVYLASTTPWTAGDLVVVNNDTTVNSTSSINSTLIADEYVFNTGDTMTGQLIISGVATDITTISNEDLTMRAHGNGNTVLTADGGGVSITTVSGNGDVTLDPHGTGNIVFSDLTNAVLTVDGAGVVTASTTVIASYIQDAYLLNDGDTGTGIFDFGGATSFELPNGSDPTVDASGEIAINTGTSSIRFYDGTAERQIKHLWSWGQNFASTTLGYDGAYGDGNGGTTTVKRAGFAYPMTADITYCRTDTGTAWVAIGDGNSTTTVNCDTTGASSTTDVAFDARDWVNFDISTSTGNPNFIYVDVTSFWTAD